MKRLFKQVWSDKSGGITESFCGRGLKRPQDVRCQDVRPGGPTFQFTAVEYQLLRQQRQVGE